MEVINALVEGLLSTIGWNALLYIFIGSLLGIVIGIIPGLSGHFAMAMLVPFIFRMDIVNGIAFLLGAHASVAMGGGITAILFSTPGTGLNAATLLDGPGMTAKGEAGRAVGAALSSSFLGAIFGVFVLTLLLPVLRSVVLVFGPAEFFMLALLALTFIAVLSGKGISMYRGLIAGALGILFSLVGMCNVTGVPRFTFGFLELWSGVPLIPVMLGLFGVAEMIDLWIKGGSLAHKATAALNMRDMQQQIFQGILDTLKHWWLVVRCSSIGTIIGIIPGLGGSTAAFIAYAHAKQTSKNPEEFGKGTIEGVIGPESANNAIEGGALAATVAFGIPGSSSMAILLAALVILGVNPGLELMTQRLDLVFVMIWTIVIGSIFGAVAGFFVVNPIARMTFLRASILAPVLLSVVFAGAFAVHSVRFDIILALVFGLLGYTMKNLDYSRPAFIIGIILGKMVERNFYLSLKLYGATFFLQPVALILLIITVVILVYNIFNFAKGDRRYSRAG